MCPLILAAPGRISWVGRCAIRLCFFTRWQGWVLEMTPGCRRQPPFWLAGGYGSREGLQKALASGAAGVQVGTNFALAMESGLRTDLRSAILREIRQGVDEAALVRTTLFSPTGYPFK